MVEEFKCSLILTFSGGGRGPGWDQNVDSNTKAVRTALEHTTLELSVQS